ncbi:MAG: 50S ribosomal protein L3 [bacterium]
MSLGIIGKKLGMTQVFDSQGHPTPITVIQAGPCYVTQIKTQANDHYSAIQLGFGSVPDRKVNKPVRGHLNRAQVGPLKTLREFRITEAELVQLSLGQEVRVDQFQAGDTIDVIGTSKGRGFTGVMKRHNFRGYPASHGTHEYFRHGGSIGCRFPQHTIKGMKMAGRYGGSRVTMQNLKVVEVRDKQNLLLVQGAVPGARNSLVVIRKAKKARSS